MPYGDFILELERAGLSIRAFADLIGMNPNSISNYSSGGELPARLAMLAMLMAELHSRGGDFREVVGRVEVFPKKPRGGARSGHFGGDRQSSLDLSR
jgi:transcriptional regulator with XRE-family HTH domain